MLPFSVLGEFTFTFLKISYIFKTTFALLSLFWFRMDLFNLFVNFIVSTEFCINMICFHDPQIYHVVYDQLLSGLMTSSLKTVLGQSYRAQFQDMFSGVEIFQYTPPRIRIRNRLCRHRFAVSAIWQQRRIIWMMTSSLKTALGQSYWEQFQDMFSGVEIFRYTPPRIRIRNRLCRHRFAVSAISQWRPIIWIMTSSLKTVLGQSYWEQFQDMFSGVEIFPYTPPRIRIRNRLCRHRFVVSAIWKWRQLSG